MNFAVFSETSFERKWRKVLATSSLFDPTIDRRVQSIMSEVASGGDRSLLQFAEQFDGVRLKARQLLVSKSEMQQASRQVDAVTRAAIKEAFANIQSFGEKSKRRGWAGRNAHGAKVGEKYDPFRRVGLYVPGGTAPLASTALMTVGLAKVAGCKEIVACTPCNAQGEVNANLLYALKYAGVTQVFKLGGAQAIAAMSFGTRTVPKADKIFGPGNAYVVAAKRLAVGHVSIDLLPGPSEVLIIADQTARAAYVAADMLAQAEHGSGKERVCLLTPSAKLARDVGLELEKQLLSLTRSPFIKKALAKNGWILQVKDLNQAVVLANQFAPEHCEIMTRNARVLSKGVVTAGAIFLGHHSPTVLGDYVAGPSHVLPTGGAGASFPGLTVDQFQRRTSVVEYGVKSLVKALPSVRAFASMEGLDAHGHSADIRKI
jgi:histidinol dehydrogenase